MVHRPISTHWLLVRLMCFTDESALVRYKYGVGKAASTVLVVVAAIVVFVAIVEAETSGVGVYVADVEQL